MFQEQIAKLTADHLRTHISAYLIEVNAQFNDGANLVVPKSIEAASVVGGMFKSYDQILPQYGIDITDKVFSPDAANLYTYVYSGQINGLVHAGSQAAVDKLGHRHAAAVEMFVRRHLILHQAIPSLLSYTLIEFLYNSTEWSGAEDLGEVDGKQMWLVGFSIDVAWIVSEDGPEQHG